MQLKSNQKNRFGLWLDKRKKHLEKMITLERAFLTHEYFKYIFFRLRLFFLNAFGNFLIHALEFYLILNFMDEKWLMASLLLSTFKIIIQGAWWGGLEQMRSEIRVFREESRSHLIAKVISRWLSGSVYIAGGLFLTFISLIVSHLLWTGDSLSPFHFYALSIAFLSSASIVVRTYHSGAFALRRVYRPVLSIVGIRFLGFFLTLLLFPIFPKMALPLVILLNGSLGLFLTYHYTARAHKALRIRGLAFDFRRKVVWRGFFKKLDISFYLAALSSGLMRFDAKIVILILYTLKDSSDSSALFLFFYLIRPLIQMSHDWAQLFYFDSVKLDLNSFKNLKLKFEKSVAEAALLMGAFCWISSFLIAVALQVQIDILLFLSLGTFYFVYSLLSYAQVRAFSKKFFYPIIATSSVIAFSLWAFLFFSLALSTCLFALSFALFASFCFLEMLDRAQVRKICHANFYSLPIWVHESSRLKNKSHKLCWLTVASKKDAPPGIPLVSRQKLSLQKHLKSLTGLTILHGRTILWLSDDTKKSNESISSVFEIFGASIEDFGSTAVCKDGKESLSEALSISPLNVLLKRVQPTRDQKSLVQIFKRSFSREDGFVINLEEEALPKNIFRKIAQKERQIILGVQRFSQDPLALMNSRDFDVTSFCEKDHLKIIFVIRASVLSGKRLAWKKTLTAFHISHHLNSNVQKVKKEKTLGTSSVAPIACSKPTDSESLGID